MNRKSCFVVFIALMLFLFAGFGESADSKEDKNWLQEKIQEFRTYPHLDRAYRMMNAGKLSQAKKELETYLGIDSTDISVRYVYLMLLNRMKDHQGVIGQANHILQRSPSSSRALLYRAMAHEALQRNEAAFADYKTIVNMRQARKSDRIYALSAIVNLNLEQKRYQDAEVAIAELVRLEPNFNNLYRQGVTLENLGQLDRAQTIYRLALSSAKATEDRLILHKSIGEIHIKQKDFADAKAAFVEAQKLAPQDPGLMRKLAVIANNQKNREEAIAWIRKAMEKGAAVEDYEFLGNVLFAMKKYDGAVREFQRALDSTKSDDDRYRIYVALGNTYAEWKKFDLAADAYTSASKIQRVSLLLRNPSWFDNAEVHENLGGLYLKMNQPQAAVESYQRAIALGRDGPEIRRSLGLAFYAMKDWNAAMESLQASGEEPLSLLYQSAVLLATNRIEESKSLLQRIEPHAESLPPEEQQRFYTQLGYFHSLDSLKFRDAEQAYKKSLAISYDPQIAFRLGRVQYLLGETMEARRTIGEIDAASLTRELQRERLMHLLQIEQKEDPVAVHASIAFRSNRLPQATPAGGALPSQGGLDVAFQPLRLSGEKRLELFGRLLWSGEPGTFSADDESYQAGLGVRWRALDDVNLILSGERLFSLGDGAMDGWLIRSSYSWDSGYALQPGINRWHYTFLYADSGYVFGPQIWGTYVELRKGLTWNRRDRLLLTPHAVADFRSQVPNEQSSSYWEAGAGISIRYLFNAGPYNIPRSTIEFLIQYKRGMFIDSAERNEEFGGWVLTTVLGV